jgi:hypothetical protein
MLNEIHMLAIQDAEKLSIYPLIQYSFSIIMKRIRSFKNKKYKNLNYNVVKAFANV